MSEISNKPLFKCACGAVYLRDVSISSGLCENGDMHESTSARNKYEREIKPGVWVDVYSVLVAFNVTNPADAHAIKKMLMPGRRGTKDSIQDREEAIASIKRAIEIERDSAHELA